MRAILLAKAMVNREVFERDLLTGEDMAVLELGRSLLRENAGNLLQADALAVLLELMPLGTVTSGMAASDQASAQPDEGRRSLKKAGAAAWLLSPSEVDAANHDWVAFCGQASAAYESGIKSLRKRVSLSRDSYAPILAILESQNPLQVFSVGIEGVQTDLDLLNRSTLAWAETLRDLVLVMIQAQVALRSRTLLALDWSAEGRGHLRKVDATYRLEIPRALFKNGDGGFFRSDARHRQKKRIYHDYSRPLIEDDGLYATLDLYLTEARPMLAKEAQSTALFLLGRNGGGGRLTQGALQQLVKRIWIPHVIHNPLRETGIPGVSVPAGPHAFRHILATGVLKRTGWLDLAADAIHDSPEVVDQHYGRYRPKDREGLLLDALRRNRTTKRTDGDPEYGNRTTPE